MMDAGNLGKGDCDGCCEGGSRRFGDVLRAVVYSLGFSMAGGDIGFCR